MTTESFVRYLARRKGYRLRKARGQVSSRNYGQFMLVEAQRNIVVLGSYFDAPLQDVMEWLTESEEVQPEGWRDRELVFSET
jgi:hypothetical protein